MQVSRWLTAFYVLAALILLASGIAFLIAPVGVLELLHQQVDADALTGLLARQTGLGLMLAALVSLVCILTPKRNLLHGAVGLYLIALLAIQGAGAVLWVIAILYLLPLLAPGLKRLPLPLPSGSREGGKVKWFNPNKGFGFIVTDDGREVFVHFKAVSNGGRRSLRNGARVTFKTVQTDRGEQADDVYIEQDS